MPDEQVEVSKAYAIFAAKISFSFIHREAKIIEWFDVCDAQLLHVVTSTVLNNSHKSAIKVQT